MVAVGEEREKGPEKIFEGIIAENFPNMGTKTVIQVRECREYHTGLTLRRNTPRLIEIKLTKIKDKEKIKKYLEITPLEAFSFQINSSKASLHGGTSLAPDRANSEMSSPKHILPLFMKNNIKLNIFDGKVSTSGK